MLGKWMPFALVALASGMVAAAAANETFTGTGFVGVEVRTFPDNPEWPGQDDATFHPSIFGRIELTAEWDGQAIKITPYGRLDAIDGHRTHLDLREASYSYRGDGFDLVLGVHQVFWGRAESRHLVNVINQVDFIENFDGEEYLGQPMINGNFVGDWGKLGLFAMTGFRKRTFPDAGGRFRGPFPIANDAFYESDSGEWHVDFAARYENTFGPLDFGASYFYGTNREPTFVAIVGPGGTVLFPYYALMNQAGVDASYVIGDLILKGEAIYRWAQGAPFFATVVGGEYTFTNGIDEGIDLGLLLEYNFDDRSTLATAGTTFNALFDNDIFTGARISFRDENDTQILLGLLVDVENGSSYTYVESSTRLADNWRLGVEARLISGDAGAGDPLSVVDSDSYVQVRATKYFSL